MLNFYVETLLKSCSNCLIILEAAFSVVVKLNRIIQRRVSVQCTVTTIQVSRNKGSNKFQCSLASNAIYCSIYRQVEVTSTLFSS